MFLLEILHSGFFVAVFACGLVVFFLKRSHEAKLKEQEAAHRRELSFEKKANEKLREIEIARALALRDIKGAGGGVDQATAEVPMSSSAAPEMTPATMGVFPGVLGEDFRQSAVPAPEVHAHDPFAGHLPGAMVWHNGHNYILADDGVWLQEPSPDEIFR